MDLVGILDRKWIKVELDARTKREAIEELIDLLASRGAITDPEAALQAVLDRESVRSTGIGYGLALPHGKYSGVDKSVMAIGRCPVGLEFDSVDGEPVDLVVLMLSPVELIAQHIQALARISRFLSFDSFRRELREAVTSDEVYEVVKRKERQANAAMD